MNIHQKIDSSKRFLEKVCEAYPATEGGLYLANSGGKDSLVCYTLLKEIGAELPIVHSKTTIDPPGTLQYIREMMPETDVLKPKESFFKLVERKMFPSLFNRYCCQILKESYGIGRNTIEGVRASESSKRAKREPVSCDTRPEMEGAQHIYPILYWTDEDVYSFIKMRGLELAPCYRDGMTRLGCVGCPQVSRKGARQRELDIYPLYYKGYKKAIERGMLKHQNWKITRYTGGDGDKAMAWWLSGKTMREFFGYDLPFIRMTKKKLITK